MFVNTLFQVAAAKGLVAGSFAIIRKDKSVVDYSAEPEGILTPNSKEIEDIQLEDVRWILVIEKEVWSYLPLSSLADRFRQRSARSQQTNTGKTQ